MPAEIGPYKLATLKCKVDTGVGGNVMPLHAFTKLFPRHINANGCKPSVDSMVHSGHTRTSNPRTPIICQTWHCGAQLQHPEEKVGAVKAHHRRQESQTGSSTPQLTTPQHKRPHEGLSR